MYASISFSSVRAVPVAPSRVVSGIHRFNFFIGGEVPKALVLGAAS
jgi:hypothetical protein